MHQRFVIPLKREDLETEDSDELVRLALSDIPDVASISAEEASKYADDAVYALTENDVFHVNEQECFDGLYMAVSPSVTTSLPLRFKLCAVMRRAMWRNHDSAESCHALHLTSASTRGYTDAHVQCQPCPSVYYPLHCAFSFVMPMRNHDVESKPRNDCILLTPRFGCLWFTTPVLGHANKSSTSLPLYATGLESALHPHSPLEGSSQSFGVLPTPLRFKLSDALCANMKVLSVELAKLLSAPIDRSSNTVLQHRNSVQMYVFFMHWICEQAEAEAEQQRRDAATEQAAQPRPRAARHRDVPARILSTPRPPPDIRAPDVNFDHAH
eukprot:gene13440-19297_t